MAREVNFSGIFGELLSLLSDARRDVAIFTLVVGGLTAIGVVFGLAETTAGSLEYGFRIDPDDTPESGVFSLFAAVVSIVGTYVLITRYLAVRGVLHAGPHRFWPYLGMAILSGLGVALGFIFLVVPGFILLVRWSAASGFLVGAREGVIDSLRASWHATKGHGWTIFLAAIALFFCVVFAAGIIGTVFNILSATAGSVVSAFFEAAASAIYSALGIAIYSLVHDDTQKLDEVFS